MPTIVPSVIPSIKPSTKPSRAPSVKPSLLPTIRLTISPTLAPTPYSGTNSTVVYIKGNITGYSYTDQFTILWGQSPTFCMTIANTKIIDTYNASLTTIKEVLPMTAQDAIVLGQTENQSTIARLDYKINSIHSKNIALRNTYTAISRNANSSEYHTFGLNTLNQLIVTQFNQSSHKPLSNITYSMRRSTSSTVSIKEIIGATTVFNGLLAKTTTNLPLVLLQDTLGHVTSGATFVSFYEQNTLSSLTGICSDPLSAYPIVWGATQTPNSHTNAFFYSLAHGAYQLLGNENSMMNHMLAFNYSLYGVGPYGDDCIFVMRLDKNYVMTYVQLCTKTTITCSALSIVHQQIGVNCHQKNLSSITILDQETLHGKITPIFYTYNDSENLVELSNYRILSWTVSVSGALDFGPKIWQEADTSPLTPTENPSGIPSVEPSESPSEQPTEGEVISNTTHANISISNSPSSMPISGPPSRAPSSLRGTSGNPTVAVSQNRWTLFPTPRPTTTSLPTNGSETNEPTRYPTYVSTELPTVSPTSQPMLRVYKYPTKLPTPMPIYNNGSIVVSNNETEHHIRLMGSAATTILITSIFAGTAAFFVLIFLFYRKNKVAAEETSHIRQTIWPAPSSEQQEEFDQDNELLKKHTASEAAQLMMSRMNDRMIGTALQSIENDLSDNNSDIFMDDAPKDSRDLLKTYHQEYKSEFSNPETTDFPATPSMSMEPHDRAGYAYEYRALSKDDLVTAYNDNSTATLNSFITYQNHEGSNDWAYEPQYITIQTQNNHYGSVYNRSLYDHFQEGYYHQNSHEAYDETYFEPYNEYYLTNNHMLYHFQTENQEDNYLETQALSTDEILYTGAFLNDNLARERHGFFGGTQSSNENDSGLGCENMASTPGAEL